MIADIIRLRQIILPAVITGLLLAAGFAVMDWESNMRYFNDMMYFDNSAIGFSVLVVLISLIWFIMSADSIRSENSVSDITAITIFSLAGAVVMISYANLTMLFLGLEILSISLYVLASSRKSSMRSGEAGFKYFIMGAFSTGFFLFGITLIYGVTGSFNLQEISAFVSANKTQLPVWFKAGAVLMLSGLAFKVSAAPFHYWAPDVYEGSPSQITAYMSTVVKVAAFAALYRLISICFIQIPDSWTSLVIVFSGLSILVGNIMATRQTSLKRLLAYSSIAHAGYMLLAIAANNELSLEALLVYGAAYSLSSLGIFVLVMSMSANDDEGISSLHGFSKAHPGMALNLTVLLLSLAGIPPLAGFFGKYYTFFAALKAGYVWPVVIAVVGSLIGLYYYLKVIIAMYKPSDSASASFRFTSRQVAVVWVAVVGTVLLGILPGFLLDLF
jgi:NADH-quinone oxidoreductase subunit N